MRRASGIGDARDGTVTTADLDTVPAEPRRRVDAEPVDGK
jgi:hypothetical protein